MNRPHFFFNLVLVLTFLVPAGCSSLSLSKETQPGLRHFYQVDDGLYRGAKPSSEGLETLKALGVRTVISLETKEESLREERDGVEALGMKFLSLPMTLTERPPDSLVLEFLETVLNPQNHGVLVHCDNGKDRTGVLIAVYRTVVQGWGPKVAYQEAKKYGFWPYRGDAEHKKFIHQLKDRKNYFERVREWTHGAEL